MDTIFQVKTHVAEEKRREEEEATENQVDAADATKAAEKADGDVLVEGAGEKRKAEVTPRNKLFVDVFPAVCRGIQRHAWLLWGLCPCGHAREVPRPCRKCRLHVVSP